MILHSSLKKKNNVLHLRVLFALQVSFYSHLEEYSFFKKIVYAYSLCTMEGPYFFSNADPLPTVSLKTNHFFPLNYIVIW